mmetsp:Transcript_2620/g.8023  ORF Transcript_2620/g.8023 Transcript_2620/m.8023 type:complete len:212 (-) Transcript_2620:256-891(-)
MTAGSQLKGFVPTVSRSIASRSHVGVLQRRNPRAISRQFVRPFRGSSCDRFIVCGGSLSCFTDAVSRPSRFKNRLLSVLTSSRKPSYVVTTTSLESHVVHVSRHRCAASRKTHRATGSCATYEQSRWCLMLKSHVSESRHLSTFTSRAASRSPAESQASPLNCDRNDCVDTPARTERHFFMSRTDCTLWLWQPFCRKRTADMTFFTQFVRS